MNRPCPSAHLYAGAPKRHDRTVKVTQLHEQKLETTEESAKRAALGDAASFSRLVLEYEGMLYRVCRSILCNEADCADAVQETIITAWQRIGQLRNPESFPAWAARICVNRCYRIARARRQSEEQAAPGSREHRSDARLDIMNAVAALPRQMKLIVVFYYFEDWSVERIAKALGLFPGTVKSRLYHARRLLAETLRDYKEANRNDAR